MSIQSKPVFEKILIANRGEIACRIIRACKGLGIKTVAVYSDADARARHVLMADEAVHIGPPESANSYLQADKIIAAARQTGAQAVHPGYGFLSENAVFAEKLAQAKLTFIGPSGPVMRKLGDKIEAKKIAAQAKVPMVPGLLFSSTDAQRMLAEAKKFCAQHGYPVMIKAAAGGGGRGMRRVSEENALSDNLAAAAREAQAAFGDGRLFMERLVEHARHVEVQVFGDGHGTVISLFDRDCSMQRNHQKVIEEAPAPGLSDSTRKAMQEAARNLCSAAGYVNAGTVEFLVDQKQQFYFLEVNSRLQVEHPVTEAITGLDLVELQIRIAAGEKLSALVPELHTPSGAAIECRICAESPEDDFVASTGRLEIFDAPLELDGGATVRFDSGFQAGDNVTHYYDSMLAKLIVHAPTREAAIAGMLDALSKLAICGVRTNLGFLSALVDSSAFRSVSHDTHFARSVLPSSDERAREHALIAALPLVYQVAGTPQSFDVWQQNSYFRIRGLPRHEVLASVNGQSITVWVAPQPSGTTFVVEAAGGFEHTVEIRNVTRPSMLLRTSEGEFAVRAYPLGQSTWIAAPRGTYEVRELRKNLKKSGKRAESHSGVISSPLPGKITVVKAAAGTKVAAGDPLLVIESMKMEHVIRSPHDAEVKSVQVRSGDVVEANSPLAELQFTE